MTFVHDLHEWQVGVATVVAFVVAALLGLVGTRRFSRSRGLHALVDNGVIGWIFSGILAVYAIAIGLMAVASWSNAAEASGIASREAAAIAGLYRDVSGLPEPTRGALQALLVRYTRDVIDEAWPLQRRGQVPHHGAVILNDVERGLQAFEPATDGQRAFLAEALHAFNGLVEARRQRLEAVAYAVPGVLWSVIVLGALLSIVASCIFTMDSFWVHATMTGFLAAMIGLLVFFMLVTDRPYHGETGVGPEAYELVYGDLMTPAGP